MELEQIETNVKKIIIDYFEPEQEDFAPDAMIAQTLDLNSLTRMELMVLLREKMGIAIPLKDFTSVVTFNDLYHCIYEHQSQP